MDSTPRSNVPPQYSAPTPPSNVPPQHAAPQYSPPPQYSPYAQYPPTAVSPYGAPAPKTNGLAIAAFVLGLLGLAIVPVVMGHLALSQIKRTQEGGRGFAITGLVLGYIACALYVLLVIVSVIAVGFAINVS